MKQLTLNLLHPDRSDIGYRTLTFNDGEPHIWIEDFDRKSDVLVRCRVSSPNDLFLLMQIGDVLKRQGIVFDLDIAYLMSMRMDRVISYGEAFSLGIVADVINRLGARKVQVLEPHSERTDREIHNCWARCGINMKPGLVWDTDIIVHPDAGAAERYSRDAHPKIIAHKKRDLSTGKILSLELQDDADEVVNDIVGHHPQAQFLVIDDLCDGGGTFAAVAELLRNHYPDRQRRIFVTHMVNPKGIQVLADNYHQVTITNSYCDWRTVMPDMPKNVAVVDVDKNWRFM